MICSNSYSAHNKNEKPSLENMQCSFVLTCFGHVRYLYIYIWFTKTTVVVKKCFSLGWFANKHLLHWVQALLQEYAQHLDKNTSIYLHFVCVCFRTEDPWFRLLLSNYWSVSQWLNQCCIIIMKQDAWVDFCLHVYVWYHRGLIFEVCQCRKLCLHFKKYAENIN